MHPTHPHRSPSRAARAAVLSAMLGAAAGAYAQWPVPVATQLKESADGIGHMLIVPYYTAQGGNATLLNIVNTNQRMGKVVKVRFRGASNADDVFNFTLFLSPKDVWAAEISEDPVTGLARLSTADLSCTLPTNVNREFSTTRLNPAADLANETREGYVEIIAMADMELFTAILDATTVGWDGKMPAPCSQGAPTPPALNELLTDPGISAAGFTPPTAGLFANWSIFNVADATSWAGAATAIVAVDNAGVLGTGKVVMHPQTSGRPSRMVNDVTSDPLLRNGSTSIQRSDVPDLSTPYVGTITPTEQAAMLSTALNKRSIENEFFTDDRVQAQTDWVITLPTRRYAMGVNYSTGQIDQTALSPDYFPASYNWFEGEGAARKSCVRWVSYAMWNRDGHPYPKDGFTFGMPNDWMKTLSLCGAVMVWSVNAGDALVPSALDARVSRVNTDISFVDGSVEMSFAAPMLGAAFAKATSTNIGAGVSGNFGLTWPHRYTRPRAVAP